MIEKVYLVEAPTGEIKIGISTNPEIRARIINGCFPRGGAKLIFASQRTIYAYQIEQHIHRIISEKRLNGEWFDIPAAEAIELVSSAVSGDLSRYKPKLKTEILRPGYRYQNDGVSLNDRKEYFDEIDNKRRKKRKVSLANVCALIGEK